MIIRLAQTSGLWNAHLEHNFGKGVKNGKVRETDASDSVYGHSYTGDYGDPDVCMGC